MSEWLTSAQAAQLMRIGMRTLYHLVEKRRIPFSRAGGKLLFDRDQLQAWLAHRASNPAPSPEASLPEIIAGSHDPLMAWAARESRSGLALVSGGSMDGIERLASARAAAALIHVPNEKGGGYNDDAIRSRLAQLPVVSLHWARREQGLILAPGNPLRVRGIADLAARECRVVLRQAGAGSNLLFVKLMRAQGLDVANLRLIEPRAASEDELAEAVAQGHADAGFGIRAAAAAAGLAFLPLVWELVDLVAWRRAIFEPPLQRLLRFGRSRGFAQQAARLGGYDLAEHGVVRFNA